MFLTIRGGHCHLCGLGISAGRDLGIVLNLLKLLRRETSRVARGHHEVKGAFLIDLRNKGLLHGVNARGHQQQHSHADQHGNTCRRRAQRVLH